MSFDSNTVAPTIETETPIIAQRTRFPARAGEPPLVFVLYVLFRFNCRFNSLRQIDVNGASSIWKGREGQVYFTGRIAATLKRGSKEPLVIDFAEVMQREAAALSRQRCAIHMAAPPITSAPIPAPAYRPGTGMD